VVKTGGREALWSPVSAGLIEKRGVITEDKEKVTSRGKNPPHTVEERGGKTGSGRNPKPILLSYRGKALLELGGQRQEEKSRGRIGEKGREAFYHWVV